MREWRKTKLLTFLGISTLILQFLQCVVLAGPVRRSSRMIREVYPEIEPEKLEGNQAEVCIVGDVVYGAEEPVPADQPCLKCKCQPPGVQCETTQCVKKPGCRAIHKPNECCPEYQCECEHEGRFYANGERLETPPGGECRVCYCRGGEVQCAEVSCYIRTDCEGRTVPGQCCPKYDHCPPREPLIDRVVPYTTQSSLTEASGYWSSSNASTEDQLTTAVYDIQGITNDDSNKITETQTEPTQSPKTTEIQIQKDTLDETNKIHIQEIKLVDEGTQTDPLDDETSKQTFIQFKDHDERSTTRNVVVEVKDPPKITIQEIIPEIKEIPITGPPKREINLRTHGQSFDENSESKIANKVDTSEINHDLALGDTESDSSEISEIYHHPPPVLKIGDQLLFLKKGQLVPGKDISTPLPVITIIGAEGLQRGTEDSGESHDVASQVQDPQKEGAVSEDPRHNDNMTERSENTSTVSTHIASFVKSKSKTDDDTTKSSLSTIENFLLNLTKVQPTASDDLYLENVDANTTIMTDNIINKIKTLANVESTTDVAHLIEKVFVADVNSTDIEFNSSAVDEDQHTTTTDERLDEAQSVTKDLTEENSSTSAEPVTLLERLESIFMTLSTEVTEKEENTTHSPVHQIPSTSSRYEELGEATKTKHDEEGLPIDQNPEYPPIPDIMSPQNVDELSEHLDSELAQVSSEEPIVSVNISSTPELLTDTTPDPGAIFRILPDVVTERHNETEGNKQEWLKNETSTVSHPLINERAALPVSILKQVAPTDRLNEEDASERDQKEKDLELELADEFKSSKELQSVIDTTQPSSTESDRSRETLEETSTEDSGESTTPRNKHASVILSVEDASVETLNNGSPELDTTDLVETIPGIQESTEETENKSVELKDATTTTVGTPDVELIDPQVLMGNTKIKENLALNSSKENKGKVIGKAKGKLESMDKESDDIFKQLNEELKTAPTGILDNKTGDEDAQAEAIFRELLEEATSSTLVPDSNTQGEDVVQPREKESALLQRVSEAITKFQMKESKESLDASILGILRDFFSSQYKYYETKK